MEHSQYKAMVHAQDTQRQNAWAFIFGKWACNEWQPLPREIKAILALPDNIGVCSNQLVTRTGAKGMIEFITRMNNRRSAS